MKREHLEHLIRAACRVADTKTLYIFGSQSILGKYPDFYSMYSGDGADFSTAVRQAEALMISAEADVLVMDSDEKTDLIEGALGEQSQFHHTNGYYAQGIDLTTCTLPSGWEKRLIAIVAAAPDGPFKGLCLEPHDMVLSKLFANRPKDLSFARSAAALGLMDESILLERLDLMPVSPARRTEIRKTITDIFHEQQA